MRHVTDCPNCGRTGSNVKSSRPQKTTGFMRRTRYCPSCARHWHTVEVDASKVAALKAIETMMRNWSHT